MRTADDRAQKTRPCRNHAVQYTALDRPMVAMMVRIFRSFSRTISVSSVKKTNMGGR